MNNKTATIFGGTGFVGRQIVRELAARGMQVKVASRVPERAYFLKPCGTPGQVVPVACDYNDYDSVARAIQGSDYVVNCVGILYERGRQTFEAVHVDLAESIAAAASVAQAARLVHLSALGANQAASEYAQSKLAGEKAVLAAFPKATILRPSVIFGPDDNFFNMFARLAAALPALPLIGGGRTKFQPIYVGDVADAAVVALTKAAVGEDNPQGQIYELGGPEVVSFKEIYQRLFRYTHQPRLLVSVPFALAKLQAFFLSRLPKPLLTVDQVESLRVDNVVSGKVRGLCDLGIRAAGMDTVLPTYLSLYQPGGRFAQARAA